MGVPVFSADHFHSKFEQLKEKKKLFAFFLYDSRPSHAVIEQFTQERYDWLDELAGFGKIYFFFPLKQTGKNEFENPSLEIAKLFNIEPAELPGIVIFTVLPESESTESKAVYYELDDQIFTDSSERIEKLFNELFKVLNRCQTGEKTPEQLLEDVQKELQRVRRAAGAGSVLHFLKRGARIVVVDLPYKMLSAMAEGFGKSIAEKAIKGT